MPVHATVVVPLAAGPSDAAAGSGRVHPIVINPTPAATRQDLQNALAARFGPGPFTAGEAGTAEPGLRFLRNGTVLAAADRAARPVSPPPPPLVLVTHAGPDSGRVIELRQGRYVLGRPGTDTVPGTIPIELEDPALSRRHAALVVGTRGVRILDTESSNGVWIDGRRVRSAELSTESLVRAGNTTFQICVPAAVRPPAVRQPVTTPLAVSQRLPPTGNSGMLLAAGLGLGLGIVLAATTGMWIFLAFSGLTALTAFAGFAAASRRRRKFRMAVADAAEQDRIRRRAAHPTHGELALQLFQHGSFPAGVAPPASLREQKAPGPPGAFTPGAACFRLGTGDAPANIALQAPAENWTPPILGNVPVTVSPAAGSALLVTGPDDATMGLLRSFLLQVPPGSSERVSAFVLCRGPDPFPADARLLPGVRLLKAANVPAAAAAISEAALRHGGAPLVLLALPSVCAEAGEIWSRLTDDVRAALVVLAGTAPGSGSSARIPAQDISASVLLREDGGLLRTGGAEQDFHPDLIGPRAFHRAAARLAATGYRDADGPEQTGLFPCSSREIAAAWDGFTEGMSPRAVLGRRGTDSVALDLVADGPHFLVAGTTGAGKSELLRTFVASLAATVPPARLNFLLIDFKGGSGLGPLAALPHTAGFLTDLNSENVARTLTTLRSELKRREALLAGAGTGDLDAYNGTVPAGGTVPRLLVVIDEFRILVDAVPTAVEELMRIAVLGRSLGLHLVLATQRPQGAVTADIRANIATSICLRVQSAVESRDVVGCDDAAAIPASSPGLAILRRAGTAAFRFQSSTVSSGTGGELPLVQTLAEYLDVPSGPRAAPGSGLAELAEAVAQAAAASGFPARARCLVQPPLPATLPAAFSANAGRCAGAVRLGLADRPEQQRQDPLDWIPARDSHLALLGPAGSGADAVLGLLVAEHVTALPGRHLYVLDGDGSLSWTASHAQAGAYVAPHEVRRAARVIAVLGQIVLHRLAGGREGPPGAAPGITLVVSGWGRWQDGFRSSRFAGAEDDLLSLVRDGESTDVCLVITGNRELLASRFFPTVPNRLWFPAGLPDDALVAWPRTPPMEPLPGRGFAQGRIGAPAGAVAQCGAPYAIPRPRPLPPGTAPPKRVEELPRYAAPECLAPSTGPDCFPLGLCGDDLETAQAHLPPGTAFLVLGPPGSGRTTLLRQFERAAGPAVRVCYFGQPDRDRGQRDPGPAASTTRHGDPVPGSEPAENSSLILVDDADRLPADQHPLLTRFLEQGCRVVLAAAPGFGLTTRLPLAARLRSDPRGALLSPGQQADADFFGCRVYPDGPPRPGRGYLINGAGAVETQFAGSPLPGPRPVLRDRAPEARQFPGVGPPAP